MPIDFIDKEKAINTMNELGTTNTPFVFMIDYEQKKSLVVELDKVKNQIYYKIGQHTNYSASDNTTKKTNHYFERNNIPISDYTKAYNKVQQHLRYGNSYLVNLTFETPIATDLSLEQIFAESTALYKLLLPGEFVVFSPETFIRTKDKKIFAHPMKGTIDASIANAASSILNNKKELAEHITIVDLIRNDMSQIAKKVKVEKFRYIDTLHTNRKSLLQVSSLISGDLPNNYNHTMGNMIYSLLPAGSICGAPKKKTLEIIEEAENYKRGFYTGVCGIYDGTNIDSGVMIRFIEQRQKQKVFKSGGGITIFSDLNTEYEELKDKIYLPFKQ